MDCLHHAVLPDQDMQTQGHMKHKLSQKLPSGINVYRETGSVCHFF